MDPLKEPLDQELSPKQPRQLSLRQCSFGISRALGVWGLGFECSHLPAQPQTRYAASLQLSPNPEALNPKLCTLNPILLLLMQLLELSSAKVFRHDHEGDLPFQLTCLEDFRV